MLAVELTDDSARPRAGLKGPRAAEALAGLGLPVPPEPNRWLPAAKGRVARLGLGEYLVEGEAAHTILTLADEGVYPFLRQDKALRLRGTGVRELLSHVTAIDPFTDTGATRALFLTLVAGVSAVLWLEDGSPDAGLTVLVDPTYGEWLEATLLHLIATLS